MVKISKPRRSIKIGDHVIYAHPGNEKLSLTGIVEGEYGEDRLLITTLAGHTGALKLCDLRHHEDI